MSHEPRTRAHEIVSPHDPHPNLERRDFAAIVERDSAASETALALSGHAEVIEDKVLRAMARAQTDALRETSEAAYPQLTGKTDTEIYEFIVDLRLSDPNAALAIMNKSTATAAATLENGGIGPSTLAAAINRAAASAGHNLQGATTDLASLNTTQILTIAGVGFGSFILTGSAGWGIGLGAIATAVQSPHLTDATINVARGAVRGATQAAALPIRGAMRTVNVIAGLGEPNLGATIQANAVGMGNDVINSIAYTFDGEYDLSTNPSNNPLLTEHLELGERFVPKELLPLVKYLKERRKGGPITALPTEAELETAGAFIAQIENLVTPDEFIAIDEKRRSGAELTDEENQKYILAKYCMLIDQNFIGEYALQPDATAVREAYEAEQGTITLAQAFASLSPQELRDLNDAHFSWSPQQAANFENNAEGMAITFENLTKHGAVGFALTAYLALTYGLMLVQGVKGVWNKGAEAKAERARKRRLPIDERPLSSRNRRRLQSSLSDREKTLGPVMAALSGTAVLSSRTEFDSGVRNLKLEDLGSTEYQTLLDLANSDSSKPEDIRNAFFALMETGNLSPDQKEALDQRKDFYTFQDTLNRLDLFYKFAERGDRKTLNLGGQEFTIGKPARGQFEFTTVNQLLQGINPRNFYRYMTNTGEGRTLRMENPQGQTIYLKIRRNGDNYEFNARDGDGWNTFKLEELQAGLVGGSTPASATIPSA